MTTRNKIARLPPAPEHPLLPAGQPPSGTPATRWDFELPPSLHASEPPEARGLRRDEVRLMVSYKHRPAILHTIFTDLPDILQAGDLLLLNRSGTLPAALDGWRADGSALRLHLSTRLPADLWVIELRQPTEQGSRPFLHARAGERVTLPARGSATLLVAHHPARRAPGSEVRLWVAALSLPAPLYPFLREWGTPIRYDYVKQEWPIAMYQTVFATEPGSAEMPSAGRAFSHEVLERLTSKGVALAPLLLHTGVASQAAGEPPYEEWYQVPESSARQVNETRARGGRVIAVGTTAVRALESVADSRGVVHPGEGWTTLVVTPERGVRVVDGILTGLHEPRATHLAMLEAIAGRAQLERSYTAALAEEYLWHEFGDLHLILP